MVEVVVGEEAEEGVEGVEEVMEASGNSTSCDRQFIRDYPQFTSIAVASAHTLPNALI